MERIYYTLAESQRIGLLELYLQTNDKEYPYPYIISWALSFPPTSLISGGKNPRVA